MTLDQQRAHVVAEQLSARGLNEPRLLAAFRKVPRHRFVPSEVQRQAYEDHPLSIGAGQTLSQPYIVALMVHHLHLQGHERVLEIGTGSGYQTAILAELVLEVFSIELIPALSQAAELQLESMGYLNMHVRTSDGSLGWPEQAPFDAIIVSAAAPHVPDPLLAQLGPRGHMVLPVGTQESQTLMAIEKHDDVLYQTQIATCVFVPLLGQHGWPPSV